MKKLILQFILIIGIMSSALIVQAAPGIQIDPQLQPEFAASIPQNVNGNRAMPINIILQLIAGSLIYAAGPIAVMMIAVGGFRYITSRGETTAMEGAKKTILWAVIGLLVIIVSYSIILNIIAIIGGTGTTGTDMSAPPAKAK